MGIDVSLRPKNRDYNYSIDVYLSREFCHFLCGPDAYANCEFNQVQKLLQIDLRLLRRYPVNLRPDIDHLEHEIYLAEEENNVIKIEELKEQMAQVRMEWDNNYDSINEGWIRLDTLEELVTELRKKITENPSYHKELKYNFSWGNYFYTEQNKEVDPKPDANEIRAYRTFPNSLLEDLQAILDWINAARLMKIEYVTFDYG